jgi:hypothetical protein
MTSPMTRHEREDLQRLVRQREKALKDAAKQRSAELLAETLPPPEGDAS